MRYCAPMLMDLIQPDIKIVIHKEVHRYITRCISKELFTLLEWNDNSMIYIISINSHYGIPAFQFRRYDIRNSGQEPFTIIKNGKIVYKGSYKI